MKILETLAASGKKDTAASKLKAVVALVENVRGTYGNEDTEITSVKVNSVNGWVNVGLLTADEKVAVAEQAIRSCISQATVVAESVQGAVFDRAFEAAVAVNPILTNINEKSDSQY